LWTDEAMVTLNVLHRNYIGLTHPLSLLQGAPIGFLWLQKTSTLAFGPGEYALRLVPLLTGCASVIVFDALARRVLGGWARCVAVAIFAMSPALVYYSTEAKQYGIDVFAIVVLCWFCVWLLDSGPTRSRALLWGCATAGLVWCSFPAAFAAGASLCVLGIAAWQRRSRSDAVWLGVGTSIWLVSFFVEYVVSLRKLHSTPALLGYWQGGFAPRPLRVGSTLSWAGSTIHGLIGLPLDLGVWPLAVVLIVCGLLTLLWRRPLRGLLFVLIIAAVFFAATVREYPLQGRLVLFLVPIAAIALAAPLIVPARRIIHVATCVLIGILLIPALASAAHATADPYTKTEAREAYLWVQQHDRPGDRVVVEWTGMAVYLYYHETLGLTGTASFQFAGSSKPCDNARQFDKLDRFKRIWFVFAVPPGLEPDAISQYLVALRHAGHVAGIHETPGNAGVVLLDMHSSGGTNVRLPAPAWQPAPYGCLTVSLFTPQSSEF
jgi:hypothetical protein